MVTSAFGSCRHASGGTGGARGCGMGGQCSQDPGQGLKTDCLSTKRTVYKILLSCNPRPPGPSPPPPTRHCSCATAIHATLTFDFMNIANATLTVLASAGVRSLQAGCGCTHHGEQQSVGGGWPARLRMMVRPRRRRCGTMPGKLPDATSQCLGVAATQCIQPAVAGEYGAMPRRTLRHPAPAKAIQVPAIAALALSTASYGMPEPPVRCASWGRYVHGATLGSVSEGRGGRQEVCVCVCVAKGALTRRFAL